jgi:trans-2,3-dihydro-3-hydroxyanthranilate isomerase
MRYFLVDVFGNSKYAGNQLAVFLDFGRLATDEMQMIAREINFSETTFVTAREKTDGGYPVRIFTPLEEIDFAGHPTLGTAGIINRYLEEGKSGGIQLNLRAGQIPVTFAGDTLWMKLNQPGFGRNLDTDLIRDLLGLESGDIDNRFPVLEVSTGLPFTIVPMKTLDALKRARVNHAKYQDFTLQNWAKGILIFCPEPYEKHQDLSARVFVNYLGIPEDPATGSGIGCLAVYLVKHRMFGAGKLHMTIGQGYEIGRPSELSIKADKRGDVYDIDVGGKVIEVAEGEWKIQD